MVNHHGYGNLWLMLVGDQQWISSANVCRSRFAAVANLTVSRDNVAHIDLRQEVYVSMYQWMHGLIVAHMQICVRTMLQHVLHVRSVRIT